MDPSDPTSFNHRTERLATGYSYHFVDQVPRNYDPATTPTILCVHGFPDLWYGWRYVVSPWVETCGWRVVVPDMLGYGGTDKLADPKYYSTKSLTDDLVALLDLIGVRKAVIVGHDWGSSTAWRFALWHPERISALVTMSIPFTPPRSEHLPLEGIAKLFPAFGYQLYFNNPSSTKEIEKNLPAFFKVLYGTDPRRFDHTNSTHPIDFDWEFSQRHSCLLNPKEFDYYVSNYKKGGMSGPLNYYRTTKHRFEEEANANLRLPETLPVLFIWGDADATCNSTQVERMHKYIPLLRDVRIPGAGHWLAIECKDVVADSVAKFVRDTFPDSPKKSRL